MLREKSKHHVEEEMKKKERRVHVYRDFITNLTPVFHGVNRHPYIYERTTNPDVEPARYGPLVIQHNLDVQEN
jgi:hypothetical protein